MHQLFGHELTPTPLDCFLLISYYTRGAELHPHGNVTSYLVQNEEGYSCTHSSSHLQAKFAQAISLTLPLQWRLGLADFRQAAQRGHLGQVLTGILGGCARQSPFSTSSVR